MVLFAIPLATVALKFGAPEYFALAIFGLSVVAGLSSDNIIKGLMVVAFGLLLTTIGIDPIAAGGRLQHHRGQRGHGHPLPGPGPGRPQTPPG